MILTIRLKKSAVTLVDSNGKKIVTSSPKATGVPANFSLGKTRSGKTIHSMPDHADHKNFTAADHIDAYKAHTRHVSELDSASTHVGLFQHHKNAINHHYKLAYADQVSKARKHIGRTRSGKTIHKEHGAYHEHYEGYSKQDHHDASHAHHKRVQRLTDAIIHFHGKGHHKFIKHLQKLVRKHSAHAHNHHQRSQTIREERGHA